MIIIPDGKTRVVLNCLINSANDPLVSISIEELRQKARTSRSTAIRHLKNLQSLGFIEIRSGRGKPCVYSIKLSAFQAIEGQNDDLPGITELD